MLALEAHHGPRRQAEVDVDHPVEVASLLHAEGFDDEIVAAALLHDTIEKTRTSPDEIERRFGAAVSRLVRAMTEDDDIPSYRQRKAEHRSRVARDPGVAAIYAADKLAKARDFTRQGERVPAEKLEHYQQTLRLLCREHPELPFLGELREELERLAADIAPRRERTGQ